MPKSSEASFDMTSSRVANRSNSADTIDCKRIWLTGVMSTVSRVRSAPHGLSDSSPLSHAGVNHPTRPGSAGCVPARGRPRFAFATRAGDPVVGVGRSWRSPHTTVRRVRNPFGPSLRNIVIMHLLLCYLGVAEASGSALYSPKDSALGR